MNDLGIRIKKLRKENNMTQQELGNIANLHASNIGRIEQGLVSPTSDVIVRISQYFNVSCDWLLRGEDSTQKLCRNDEEYIMLEMFRKLSASNRIEIHELIEFKLEKETRKKTEISSSSTTLKPNNGKDMVG